MTYRNNLQKYRIWKNITQKELAEELNINIQKFRKIDNNKSYPRKYIRDKLLEYFNVSFEQMFYCNNCNGNKK